MDDGNGCTSQMYLLQPILYLEMHKMELALWCTGQVKPLLPQPAIPYQNAGSSPGCSASDLAT